jgi:signal transduction histidine kinase
MRFGVSISTMADQNLFPTSESIFHLLDEIEDGIVLVDSHQKRIRWANKAFAHLVGENVPSVLGRSLEDWLLEQDRSTQIVHLKSGAKGTSLPVQMTTRLLEIEPSKTIQLIRFCDRQEITQLESRIRQLETQKKVDEKFKVESLKRLAGKAAHDFNNMLTVIIGNSELLTLEPDISFEVKEIIKQISQAGQQAADLCQELMTFAGRKRIIPRPVNMNELIQEVLANLSNQIPKNVNLRSVLAPYLPDILIDQNQIYHVVENLIRNAIQAIGSSEGEVVISSDIEFLHVEVEEQSAESFIEGKYVYVTITDTGSGMSEETKNKLFEPFFSTKPKSRGLGLATVHGIVRNHHGRISVTSEIGSGSTFRIWLPSESQTNPLSM